ncbi:hypothetical protein [Glutamicibacter sp.]|uniref:hypothetical protein n=1 Tax=Glutamicibacter sp. TaxID=1931995 RepID=UPI003D6B57EF
MTSPGEEPRNPYSSGHQGQNRQYQQPGSYDLNGVPQQPYYNQQAHGQPGQYPQGNFGYPPASHFEGAQLAQTSMILGILSLFVAGVILGPIAISKANKAEREFSTVSTVGKVTGWIGTILGVLWVLYIAFIVIGTIAFSMDPSFSES